VAVLKGLASAAVAVGALAQPAVARQRSVPVSESVLVARLTALVDSLARADRFAGVVLLARGSTPVLQRAWGMADRERSVAANADTRFNIGSIGKAFTATLIHQLIAEGRLELDDTLITRWPEYPNRAVAASVTVRQLLEHRSGIGGFRLRLPRDGGSRRSLRTVSDHLATFVEEPLQFEPGTEVRYSNDGYVVLGGLVERLTGRSYYDEVRSRVLGPAGMTEAEAYFADSLPPLAAIGYTRLQPTSPEPGPLRAVTEELPGRPSPAGGMWLTASDLLRFAVAARDQRVRAAPALPYRISGGAPGVNAVLDVGLPGEYTLIVLANQDPPVAEQLDAAVRRWLGVAEPVTPR
jgi:CubicO group peptidase (beta-lactamase class C family)